jgi:hypothetical protein
MHGQAVQNEQMEIDKHGQRRTGHNRQQCPKNTQTIHQEIRDMEKTRIFLRDRFDFLWQTASPAYWDSAGSSGAPGLQVRIVKP